MSACPELEILRPVRKMHVDEVETDVLLVGHLLAAQFPQWADLPIEPVASAGTDNALYRLGSDMVVRLPRIHWATRQVTHEQKWLPRLAPHLSLDIPVQLAIGLPGEGYPWHWGIYRWLAGDDAINAPVADLCQAAMDLAHFIAALQQIDPADGPLAEDDSSRGVPLARRDARTRQAISALQGIFDADELTAAWETALQAPAWERLPVWFHGDLLPGNLLFTQGRLSAVIDFSGLGVGDPACDLLSAWSLFSGESREMFRTTLAVDEATWARGRGHALSQAAIFIPYYLDNNRVGVSNACHALEQVLADSM